MSGLFVTVGEIIFQRNGTNLTFADGSVISLPGIVGGRFTQSVVAENEVGGDLYTGVPVLTYRGGSPNLSDFDGNGHADILWHNTSGALSSWTTAGTTNPEVRQNVYNAASPPGWTLLGSLDDNGDGLSDGLWRNEGSGALAIWSGDGRGGLIPGGYVSGGVDGSWKVAGLGDFDGDGRDDVLWRNRDGNVTTWLSTGLGFNADAPIVAVDSGRHIQGSSDFDGDRTADILWRNDDGSLSNMERG